MEVRRGLAEGTIVKGRLHVPSFQTDTAFVIVEAEETPGSNDAKVVWIPVTGFVGRNRAFHGDIVAARPLWTPWRAEAADKPERQHEHPASGTATDSSICGKSSPQSKVLEQRIEVVSPKTLMNSPLPPPPISSAPSVASPALPPSPLTTPVASPTEPSASESQASQLRKRVAMVLHQAGPQKSMPLSILGGHPEVRRLRLGKGKLQRKLSAMDDVFDVRQEGNPAVAVVAVKPGVALELAGLEESGLQVQEEGTKSDFIANTSESDIEAQRAELRSAVVDMLQSEDGVLPLSIVGSNSTVQRLRRGLGSLAKILRCVECGLSVSNEGHPPEPTVRLVRAVTEAQPSKSTALAPAPALASALGSAAAADDFPSASSAGSDSGKQGSNADDAPSAVDTSGQTQTLDQARCRVVAILERSLADDDIVATLHNPWASSDSFEDAAHLSFKAQPRDRRLPAFWIAEDAPKGVSASGRTSSVKAQSRAERHASARFAAQAGRAAGITIERLKDAFRQTNSSSLLCILRFRDWSPKSMSPYACVSDILGEQGCRSAESDALLAFYGLEWRQFKQDIEKKMRDQFPGSTSVVAKALQAGRADLRHLRCFTVDPPHAKDLDDALSVEPGLTSGTYRIGVHIADVSHFVSPGSDVDMEARRRATTVYLVGKVYPMLPQWLSENLCSLLPDGDRLSFSVHFSLDTAGRLVPAEPPTFARAVIRTRGRFDYRQVDGALLGQDRNAIPADALEDLRTMSTLASARRQLRVESGAVTLSRSQLSFQFDEDGRVDGLSQEDGDSFSHHLVEEFMVLANHVVALELVRASDDAVGSNVPTSEAEVRRPLLRRHPDTEGEVRKSILRALPKQLRDSAPDDASLSALLEWCRQRQSSAAHEALCATALTAFKEAKYFVVDGEDEQTGPITAGDGHWALDLPAYMHFTSPIRRYADILVHRRLGHILDLRAKSEYKIESPANPRDVNTAEAESCLFLYDLEQAVKNCNTKKRNAQDAQIDATQLALTELVHRKGGLEVDDAVITRIIIPPKPSEDVKPVPNPQRPPGFKRRLTDRNLKEALEIYVPLAQCTRSVSLESLNLEALPGIPIPDIGDAGHAASDSCTLAPQPGRRQNSDGGCSGPAPRSVWVRVREADADSAAESGQAVELRVFEPIAVKLVCAQDPGTEMSSSRHWTVRFAWAVPPAKHTTSTTFVTAPSKY